jgi:hypothetical protein
VSRRSFVVLLAALAAVCVLQSWAHVWEVLHRSRLDTAFDLDRSNGLPDVLSTIVIAAAAGGAAVLASRQRGRPQSTSTALAGVLTLVALEDLLHLRPGVRTIADLVTGITAVAGLGLLAHFVLDKAGGGYRARAMLALGLLALAGSLLVGALPELEQWFERARGDPIIEWQIVAKQGLELVGWWLIAMGLWDAALQRGGCVPRRSPVGLRDAE